MSILRGVNPSQEHDMRPTAPATDAVIFRMTITRNGRKIRRADGRPWKIVIRK